MMERIYICNVQSGDPLHGIHMPDCRLRDAPLGRLLAELVGEEWIIDELHENGTRDYPQNTAHTVYVGIKGQPPIFAFRAE